MNERWPLSVALTLGLLVFASCAAPAPTATPTRPPAAAPTPTKAPTATPTKRPLQKASHVLTNIAAGYITYFVAEAQGYLREEGLDIDMSISGAGAKTLAAASSGDVDFATFSGLDLISAVVAGAPAQAFMAYESRQRGSVVLRKDVAGRLGITEKTSYAEKARLVKGLSFAASSPNSGTDLRVRYFLWNGGVDPDRDVTITYMALAGIPAALEQGAVDGAGPSDADVPLLFQKGTVVSLVDYAEGKMPGAESQISAIAATRKENMQKRSEVYEAYVRAIWRAMDLIKANADGAFESARKAYFPDMDLEPYRLSVQGELPVLSFTPDLTKPMLDGAIAFVAKARPDQPAPHVRYEDYYTDRFVQAAKKQLGK